METELKLIVTYTEPASIGTARTHLCSDPRGKVDGAGEEEKMNCHGLMGLR
jgi:hypothetical protein